MAGRKDELKESLKGLITHKVHDWSLREQELPPDHSTQRVIVHFCGFLIFTLAYEEHVEELWDHALRSISHKQRWIDAINKDPNLRKFKGD